jgi:serine/threonine protein kinase
MLKLLCRTLLLIMCFFSDAFVTQASCWDITEKKLGKGSFGEVYLAEKDGKKFAVKISNLSEERESLKEVEVLKKVKGPSFFIEFIDHFSSRGNFYIVLELADIDLLKFIKKSFQHQISFDIVERVLTQMLCALYFLEGLGIVHTDIKPANILIKYPDQVKLCDFGLCEDNGFATAGEDFTTLWYRSPELALYSNEINHETDIWSLACVVLELVAGAPVFRVGESCRNSLLMMQIFHLWKVKERDYRRNMQEISPASASYPFVVNHFLSSYQIVVKEGLLSRGINFFDSPPSGEKVDLNYLLFKMLQMSPQNRPNASDLMRDLGIL